MTRLKDDSGDWPNTDSKIEELMLVYFQNLFSSEGSSSEECLRMIMPSVSESDNTNLLAPFPKQKSKWQYSPCIQISPLSQME